MNNANHMVTEALRQEVREQAQALVSYLQRLEETAESSSTGGIREFRRERVKQLYQRREELDHRVSRWEQSVAQGHPYVLDEGHALIAELREAASVARQTFA